MRLPAEKTMTDIHVLAEQVKTWLWFKKRYLCPVLKVHLNPKRRQKVSDAIYEYPTCRLNVNIEKIRELDKNCFTRLKVKWGKKAIRKAAVNLKHLFECFQNDNHSLGKIHVVLDVSSFYPLTLKTEAKEGHTHEHDLPATESEKELKDNTKTAVVEAIGGEPVHTVTRRQRRAGVRCNQGDCASG